MNFKLSNFRSFELSAPTARRSGSVLMEAVLCLPLLLFLVTGIVQFARIWEARLFTRHAAYNAARAALVYNVAEYADIDKATGKITFKGTSGPVWVSAVNTLAWKSATSANGGNASDNYAFPGFLDNESYRIDNSAFIRSQVMIDGNESWESNGVVRVTVKFKFPLLFSVFALGSVQGNPESEKDIGPDAEVALVHDVSEDIAPHADWEDSIPHILLAESCLLPKPWSTANYPRVSSQERSFLEM